MKTLIQGGYVVGFNGTEHEILKNGVVVIDGDKILFVGEHYPEPTDEHSSMPAAASFHRDSSALIFTQETTRGITF